MPKLSLQIKDCDWKYFQLITQNFSNLLLDRSENARQSHKNHFPPPPFPTSDQRPAVFFKVEFKMFSMQWKVESPPGSWGTFDQCGIAPISPGLRWCGCWCWWISDGGDWHTSGERAGWDQCQLPGRLQEQTGRPAAWGGGGGSASFIIIWEVLPPIRYGRKLDGNVPNIFHLEIRYL